MTVSYLNPRFTRQVQLRGALDGKIRTATYRNVEHLVVPVIALMEGVIWPMNAETPELVLEEELLAAPDGWNGRPVVNDHPILGGGAVSANLPKVLEAEAFGLLFNTYVDKKKLHTEAWMNPELADLIGERAVEILDRARAHDDIEVSVGVFTGLEDASGNWYGQPYHGIWRGIVPDHLAMLSKGSIGACSVEMGCGAPRTARIHVLSRNNNSITIEERSMANAAPAAPVAPAKQSFLKGLAALFTKKEVAGREPRLLSVKNAAADMSDNELRSNLDRELRAIVPGYMWIEAVFPDDGIVVFSSMPRENWLYFQQEFSVRGGTVKLKGEPVEVEPVTRFEPADGSGEGVKAASAPCGCGGSKGDEMSKTIKERVAALIASPKNAFTAAQAPVFETFTDAQLKALEDADAAAAGSTPPAQPETPPATPPASSTPSAQAPGQTGPTATPATPPASSPAESGERREAMSREDWIKAAPPEVRTLLEREEAREKATKDALVAKLKGAQSAYTETELKALSIDQLNKLAQIANVKTGPVDLSLNVPRDAASGDDEVIPPAPSILKALREQKKPA